MNQLKGAGFASGALCAISLPFLLSLAPSLLGPMAGTPTCHTMRKPPIYSPDGMFQATIEIYTCDDDGHDGPLYVLDVKSSTTTHGALLLTIPLKQNPPPTPKWEELRRLRITGFEHLWPKEIKSNWCGITLETDART
jgi:hypothetical protein